jgi:hypothetical protein
MHSHLTHVKYVESRVNGQRCPYDVACNHVNDDLGTWLSDPSLRHHHVTDRLSHDATIRRRRQRDVLEADQIRL